MLLHIICQNSHFSFDIDRIIEAISLLELRREKNRINKRIQSLLQIADDITLDSVEYQRIYERVLELLRLRELIKQTIKAKCARIHVLLHTLWVNRVKNASRASAGLSLDPMSESQPIPPMFDATVCSFGHGRNSYALSC